MNKRIKQFAEQSLMDYELLPEISREPVWIATDDDLEKFAEFIVRECAELSMNSQYVNTKSEYYEGFNEALIYVGNKIKEHFGVEE